MELSRKIAQTFAKTARNFEEFAVRHLKIDVLSLQQRENTSIVDQVLDQVQDLQENVDSVNDAREFCDLETSSSSTRNSFGTSGNVLLAITLREFKEFGIVFFRIETK